MQAVSLARICSGTSPVDEHVDINSLAWPKLPAQHALVSAGYSENILFKTLQDKQTERFLCPQLASETELTLKGLRRTPRRRSSALRG